MIASVNDHVAGAMLAIQRQADRAGVKYVPARHMAFHGDMAMRRDDRGLGDAIKPLSDFFRFRAGDHGDPGIAWYAVDDANWRRIAKAQLKRIWQAGDCADPCIAKLLAQDRAAL